MYGYFPNFNSEVGTALLFYILTPYIATHILKQASILVVHPRSVSLIFDYFVHFFKIVEAYLPLNDNKRLNSQKLFSELKTRKDSKPNTFGSVQNIYNRSFNEFIKQKWVVDSSGEPEHKFDVIYMNMLFDYLIDAEAEQMITRSIAHLNLGGHLIISYVSKAKYFGYIRTKT